MPKESKAANTKHIGSKGAALKPRKIAIFFDPFIVMVLFLGQFALDIVPKLQDTKQRACP